MDDALFERLLYEEESNTLDFKRDQYPFAKADDASKSELLKDILGFANAWRRSEAYILVGVEDVRGGRATVFGIAPTDHLHDHSLQQFVSSLTNRPVRFHYEAFGFEGKQVGIIRIEEQVRPLFLKKDFGVLNKGEVYVRRGSSTDRTKPADPDEIALMGAEVAASTRTASLSIEFASPKQEKTLGDRIEWNAEFCEMPPAKSIPKFNDRSSDIRLPGGQVISLSDYSSPYEARTNRNYYRDLAEYTFFRRFFRELRLVVTNTGDVPASDVRVEILVPGGAEIVACEASERPQVPKRRSDFAATLSANAMRFRPARRHPGHVEIEKCGEGKKLELECGNLQPGRKVWSDTFFVGLLRSGPFSLTGHLLASNLQRPQEFILSFEANVAETTMSVDELVALDDPTDDRD